MQYFCVEKILLTFLNVFSSCLKCIFYKMFLISTCIYSLIRFLNCFYNFSRFQHFLYKFLILCLTFLTLCFFKVHKVTSAMVCEGNSQLVLSSSKEFSGTSNSISKSRILFLLSAMNAPTFLAPLTDIILQLNPSIGKA